MSFVRMMAGKHLQAQRGYAFSPANPPFKRLACFLILDEAVCFCCCCCLFVCLFVCLLLVVVVDVFCLFFVVVVFLFLFGFR